MFQQPALPTEKIPSIIFDGYSVTIKFNSISIYQTYKDIISKYYGRNFSVQNKEDLHNGTIQYKFKCRGYDVCITVFHNVINSVIHVDGIGGPTWWKEASSLLEKECEKLRSEELKEQGSVTGKNKKPLVSEEEFHKYFANPLAYGTKAKKWPHSTILLYKYSSNATTKYCDIPEDTWKRIDNDKSVKHAEAKRIDNDESVKHAEAKMIEDLEYIQDYLTIQPDDYEGDSKAILSIEVISSYSPCYECSEKLFKIKEQMDKRVKQRRTRIEGPYTVSDDLSALSLTTKMEVKFKITFSNFYRHLEKYDKQNMDGKKNMDGLKNLLRSDIKLDIFNDDNWHYLLNSAGLVTERQKREGDDKKILQYLEECVTYERLPAALQAMKGDLRKNKLF